MSVNHQLAFLSPTSLESITVCWQSSLKIHEYIHDISVEGSKDDCVVPESLMYFFSCSLSRVCHLQCHLTVVRIEKVLDLKCPFISPNLHAGARGREGCRCLLATYPEDGGGLRGRPKSSNCLAAKTVTIGQYWVSASPCSPCAWDWGLWKFVSRGTPFFLSTVHRLALLASWLPPPLEVPHP